MVSTGPHPGPEAATGDESNAALSEFNFFGRQPAFDWSHLGHTAPRLGAGAAASWPSGQLEDHALCGLNANDGGQSTRRGRVCGPGPPSAKGRKRPRAELRSLSRVAAAPPLSAPQMGLSRYAQRPALRFGLRRFMSKDDRVPAAASGWKLGRSSLVPRCARGLGPRCQGTQNRGPKQTPTFQRKNMAMVPEHPLGPSGSALVPKVLGPSFSADETAIMTSIAR